MTCFCIELRGKKRLKEYVLLCQDEKNDDKTTLSAFSKTLFLIMNDFDFPLKNIFSRAELRFLLKNSSRLSFNCQCETW